ncbi:MAG: hypothetical protein ABI635_11695, partial [Actinomycetota bacterium]
PCGAEAARTGTAIVGRQIPRVKDPRAGVTPLVAPARHLAIDEAQGNADAIAALLRAARSG